MAKAATPKKPTPKKPAAKKAVAKKAAPVTADVVTLRHLALLLAEKHELSNKKGAEILAELIELIGGYLKKGKKIRLAGLGILQVRKRAARMGRKPATGEAIKIKASKKIAFRAAKDLKEQI